MSHKFSDHDYQKTRRRLLWALILIAGLSFLPRQCSGFYYLPWVMVIMIYGGSLLVKKKVSWWQIWQQLKKALLFILTLSLFLPLSQETWGEGFILMLSVMSKAIIALFLLILLIGIHPMAEVLRGLLELKVPPPLVMILFLMNRYRFLIAEEWAQMKMAADLRSGLRSGKLNLQTYARMLGVLFIRSAERAERVRLSMVARGFRADDSASLKRLLHEFE